MNVCKRERGKIGVYTKWKAFATYIYNATKGMALKDIDFADETAMKKELLVEMRKSAQPFSLLFRKTARTPPPLFVCFCAY